MKKLFLCMLLCLTVLAFVGCGQSKEESPVDKESREMVVGLIQPAANLDQQTSLSEIDAQYFSQIYDTLFKKNAQGEFEGALAESYTVSDDKLQVIIKLRQGVMFTNGKEFKAEDYAYTIERGKAYSGTAQYFVNNVDSVEVIDDYNIIVHIEKPNAAIMDILSVICVLNKEATEAAGDKYGLSMENVCGCGPYILKDWKVGGDVILEANEDYYAGVPDIKKIRMVGITDATAAVVALQTGEIDLYMADIPGSSVNDIKASKDLTFSTYASNLFHYLVLNTKEGLFSDLKMRQAVAYALNRDDALTVGTDGYGTIVNTVASYAFTGDPTDVKWYSQDIEKAKSLVKEAGKEGASVTLYTLSFDPYIQLATLVQSQLNEIGLNVKVQQLENNAFIDQMFDKNDYEISVTFWNSDIKDFDSQISSFLHTDYLGASGNVSLYSNPKLDALIDEGRQTYDPKEREKIYAKAMEIVYQDVPLIPLHFAAGSRAYSKNLQIEPELLQYRYLNNFHWVE